MTVTHLPVPWIQQLIANGGDGFPEYRSRAWAALDDGDPRKVAGIVDAAERWWALTHTGATVSFFTSPRRARELAEARRPRPGDHPGGPVPLWELDGVAGE